MGEYDIEPWSGYDDMSDIDLWNLEHYPPGILKSTAIAPQSFENQKPSIPGISPVGVGTPGTAKIRVSKPHIPYGTGYNLLKKTPGFSNVFNNVAKDTNIVEFDPNKAFDKKYGFSNELPAVRTARLATHSNINSAQQNGGWDHYLRKYMSRPSYAADKFSQPDSPRGTYSSRTKTATVPVQQYPRKLWGIPAPFNEKTVNTRRHEFIHRMQSPDMPRYSSELDAFIGANKSIRKGLQQMAPHAEAYIHDHAVAKYPDSKLKSTAEYIKGGLSKSTPTAFAGYASKLVPGKPGMFTGRVPSMRGLGGGLMDMFMEGPELQKAKTDPLYGMGTDERAKIEAAYEYGL